MADFHQQGHENSNQQRLQMQQQQQLQYIAELHQQQQQFIQQRPHSQPMMQAQMSSSNGMSSSMQHNFMATHHQQFRSATPPQQNNMIQQRQPVYTHPSMLQQTLRQQQQQQQGSPGSPYQQLQQQSIQQRPIVIRQHQVIAQQQQQRNIQQQQQYMQFVRQSGMQNNIVQVTSTSSPILVQQQFAQPSPQVRQILFKTEPNVMPTRQNVVIQREQQNPSSNNFIRAQIPVTTSMDRLTPQQEMHVLQQHFPTTKGQPQATIYLGSGMPQRIIVHQEQQPQQQAVTVVHQQQHQQHQQIPMSQASILNTSTSSGAILQQQQRPSSMSGMYVPSPVGTQMQSPPQQQQFNGGGKQLQQQQNIQSFTTSPPTSYNVVLQQQPQLDIPISSVGPINVIANTTTGIQGISGGAPPRIVESESANAFVGKEPKQERCSSTMEQQPQEPSPSNGAQSDTAAETPTHVANNTAPATSKSSKKGQAKAAASANKASTVGSSSKTTTAKGGQQPNKPAPAPVVESDLLKASVSGTTALKLLEKSALNAFVKTVDPDEILEDEVIDNLQLIMDEFAEDIIRNSVDLCNHRGSNKLEPKDVRYVLTNQMKMAVPAETVFGGTLFSNVSSTGGATGGGAPPTKRPALIAHQQRMTLIDKSLKKL